MSHYCDALCFHQQLTFQFPEKGSMPFHYADRECTSEERTLVVEIYSRYK